MIGLWRRTTLLSTKTYSSRSIMKNPFPRISYYSLAVPHGPKMKISVYYLTLWKNTTKAKVELLLEPLSLVKVLRKSDI